jgi:hypothetical protein
MKSALHSRVLILLVALLVVATGCRKLKNSYNSTTTTISPTPEEEPVGDAGRGGESSLILTPNHDGLNIDSCMFYLKYNSSVISADGIYDDSTKAVNVKGTPVASFYGLKAGKYYIFAKGWDIIRSEKVKGGIPFTITQTNKATEHTLVIPIQDYE